MDEIKKNVDEGWKDKAEKEKQKAPEHQIPPDLEASFGMFISGLGMQALAALGELENPLTNKKELDINQARYLIDILAMLQDKTKGNLAAQETQVLENLLYQLRMVYVEKSK